MSWCTGTFTFGREGHGSLLSWNPPRSIHPTHVAFSTGYGATGTFSFDSFFSKGEKPEISQLGVSASIIGSFRFGRQMVTSSAHASALRSIVPQFR